MNDNDTQNLNTQDLRELKTQYNKAKDVLEKINSLSIRYDAAFKAFDTRNIDTERVANEIRQKSTLIETAKTEAAKLVNEIKANIEKIQTSITEIEDSSAKFEGLKGRIEGKEGEMDALLSASKGLRDDVEKTKITAQQRLSDIDNLLVQVQDKITQMQTAYEGFVAVYAKITDSNTGLQAILDQSIELQRQSNSTFNDIKSFHEQSKNHLEKIKLNKVETERIKSEIQNDLKEVNSNKSEIQKITELITDTGFANSFQKREKMLRRSAGIWLIVLVLSIGGLSWMLYGLFSNPDDVPKINIILYRITLTSPLLFLIIVAIKQYSNERALNEKYAFKATIAAVIRNHSDFLKQVNEEKSEENTTFVRTVLGGVYVEPYDKGLDIKDVKRQLKDVVEEKREVKELKLSEVLDNAKELKELIPNDESLKSVIELLLKFK